MNNEQIQKTSKEVVRIMKLYALGLTTEGVLQNALVCLYTDVSLAQNESKVINKTCHIEVFQTVKM